MKNLIALFILSLSFVKAIAGFDPNHLLFTELLKANVKDGVVNYQNLKKTPEKLEAYIAQIKAVSAEQYASLPTPEKMAYLINAYNAYTLKLISDFYPVKSIREIGSLVGGNLFNKSSKQWRVSEYEINGKRFTIEAMGKPVTLDEIEHENLRPLFKDARVHFALVCGAVSCPFLRSEAYVAKELSSQLDSQGKQFLADPFRNRYDEKTKTLYLSKIFDWFSSDFKRDAASVKDFVKKYLPANIQAKITEETPVEHLEYDWSLNNVAGKIP